MSNTIRTTDSGDSSNVSGANNDDVHYRHVNDSTVAVQDETTTTVTEPTNNRRNNDTPEVDNWIRQDAVTSTINTPRNSNNITLNGNDIVRNLNNDNQQQQLLMTADSDTHHHHHDDDDVDDEHLLSPLQHLQQPQPPTQPELTMKEKLVLRERQRRIETERARLKQQFALNNQDNNDEDDHGSTDGSSSMHHDQHAGGHHHHHHHNDNHVPAGSVAGTLGEESIVAHPDVDIDDTERQEDNSNVANNAGEEEPLGFNMERFLRQRDTFSPQLDPVDDSAPLDSIPVISAALTTALPPGSSQQQTAEPGVVMERFLNEPVIMGNNEPSSLEAMDHNDNNSTGNRVVEIHDDNGNNVDNTQSNAHNSATLGGEDVNRSVSFDVDREPRARNHGEMSTGRGPPSLGDISLDANASVQVEADEDYAGREDPMVSLASVPSNDAHGSVDTSESDTESGIDEPRVLRLTQADMAEMAAIEVASIGNAPPSEREEDDILSEVGELMDFGGSGLHHEAGTMSQDTPTTAMESSSIGSGAQSAPPVSATSAENERSENMINERAPSRMGSGSESGSDTVRAHPPSERANDDGDVIMPIDDNDENGGENDNDRRSPSLHSSRADVRDELPRSNESTNEPLVPVAGVANRRLRPGMTNTPTRTRSNDPPVATAGPPVDVEGFDFDKNADGMPTQNQSANNSYNELPGDDSWPEPGPMVNHLSFNNGTNNSRPRGNYGTLNSMQRAHSDASSSRNIHSSMHEKAPLLDIPPEIITLQEDSMMKNESFLSIPKPSVGSRREVSRASAISAVDSIFSQIIEEERLDNPDVMNDSDKYRLSSILKRVTLLFEVPVLLMISGGSDNLCALIGRRRYQLLVGFLPLTSAISGNVGLQASTLTTRAVSHSHIEADSFMPWLLAEVSVAIYLGLAMGTMLGSLAFFAGGMDFPFGLTIFIAQFISIVTAGCTGTLAPLIFSFIFRQDSGKWGGPLETAIQDIVGSFAMVIVSYHILLFFEVGPIDPSDYCGERPDGA